MFSITEKPLDLIHPWNNKLACQNLSVSSISFLCLSAYTFLVLLAAVSFVCLFFPLVHSTAARRRAHSRFPHSLAVSSAVWPLASVVVKSAPDWRSSSRHSK